MKRLLCAFSLMLASAGHAEPLKVVTSFTVIQDLAQNVAGDAAVVVSITRPGAEVHGYQPTPQDIVKALGADLILWNGMNLELWFEKFMANLGDVPSAVLSDGIDPILIETSGADGFANPHAWMGLQSALIYVDNVQKALSEIDPDNSAIYRANASAYKDEITRTITPLREAIETIDADERWLVTCEGAFSYLARDFGLKEASLWPINADALATPQQVRAVVDLVKEKAVPAVFCESTVNQASAQQVARETGARYGGVLYVDSLSAPDGAVPTYLDMLRVTSETIVEGLGGRLR